MTSFDQYTKTRIYAPKLIVIGVCHHARLLKTTPQNTYVQLYLVQATEKIYMYKKFLANFVLLYFFPQPPSNLYESISRF